MATPLQQDGMRNTQLCGASCAAETRLNKKQQGFYLSGRSMTRNTSRRQEFTFRSFLRSGNLCGASISCISSIDWVKISLITDEKASESCLLLLATVFALRPSYLPPVAVGAILFHHQKKKSATTQISNTKRGTTIIHTNHHNILDQ